MSDAPAPDDAAEPDAASPDVDRGSDARRAGVVGIDTDGALTSLAWIGFALLSLLAIVATFRLYTNVSRAIARFVAPTYEPVFQAAFNLVVLLLALAGIALLVRRLAPSE